MYEVRRKGENGGRRLQLGTRGSLVYSALLPLVVTQFHLILAAAVV